MSLERVDLTDAEREALHDVTLGTEHVQRAYGHLLAFHHQVGRGMDQFDRAETVLRATGHGALADRLRDEILPAGVVGDRWSYELVEAFEREFLAETTAFASDARDGLADGVGHVSEREQQRRWRERADRRARARRDAERGEPKRASDDRADESDRGPDE